MTGKQSGLRFDIYERVHLADNTVGIKELDEVELVPHIHVYTEGEQAVLKGNLYLAGKYEGETGAESRTLEHFIPVEITLPMNRIHDLDQVSVDIDHFDVDLLSARSLNVTGVLTLRGIEMISTPEENWREDEETVFVHEERAQEEPEASAPAEESPSQPEPFVQPGVAVNQRSHGFPGLTQTAEPAQPKVQEEQPVQEASADFEEQSSEFDELQQTFAVAEGADALLNDVAPVVAEAETDTQEEKVKVAFSSRAANDQSYHLKSLIHTGGETRSFGKPGTSAVEEAAPVEPRGNSVEWKKLFVRDDEQQSFKRVRMCIVQKEESLNTIAERYSINPREILLYNRLEEQDIAEGKVLYIPK